jgi:hypothetical protein
MKSNKDLTPNVRKDDQMVSSYGARNLMKDITATPLSADRDDA